GGRREQGTGNREQGTGNREQGTGNRQSGRVRPGCIQFLALSDSDQTAGTHRFEARGNRIQFLASTKGVKTAGTHRFVASWRGGDRPHWISSVREPVLTPKLQWGVVFRYISTQGLRVLNHSHQHRNLGNCPPLRRLFEPGSWIGTTSNKTNVTCKFWRVFLWQPYL
ncbi:hypothetical protein E1H12_17645, partial [Geitlerinema sp. P-1104]|nr:hypothetical protein [Geitlerinema sp. P-1104]